MKTPIYILLALFVASCSMEKRRYSKGYHITRHCNFHSEVQNDNVERVDAKSDMNATSEIAEDNIEEPHISDEIAIYNDENSTDDVSIEKSNPDTLPKKDSFTVLAISPKVGEVIDSLEKAQYKLFPFLKKENYVSARFIQYDDGKIFLIGTMKDSSEKKIAYSPEQIRELVKNYFNEDPKDITEQMIQNTNEKSVGNIIYTGKKTLDPLAVTSFIFGFLGLACIGLLIVLLFTLSAGAGTALLISGLFLSILGMALGISSLRNIKESYSQLKGEDYARMGIVLGMVALLIPLLLIALLFGAYI